MKFKRKIRQPKKAKKVTLARIRDIVKEELAEACPMRINLTPQGERLREKVLSPSIRPVSPPPRVSAKKIADLPPIALPDEYEIEEEKI